MIFKKEKITNVILKCVSCLVTFKPNVLIKYQQPKKITNHDHTFKLCNVKMKKIILNPFINFLYSLYP